MIPRAWMVWAVLATAGVTQAKPPERTNPQVDGTATPALTQTYYTPESGPSLRLLDAPAIVPAIYPQPLRGLPPMAMPSSLDVPIPVSFLMGTWQAKTAFEIAELNASAMDGAEAARWYEEVIRQAPNSVPALAASQRLAELGRNR